MFSATLYVSALGTPIPGTFVVLAGGAFVQQGVLDWRLAFLLGLVGVVLGDSTSYAMGRLAKTWVQRRFGQSSAWKNAQTVFERRGGFAIYLTRCFVTPLAIPTNLIAGSGGYAYWRFLVYDALGEITWLVVFGGLGFFRQQLGSDQPIDQRPERRPGRGGSVKGWACIFCGGADEKEEPCNINLYSIIH